MADELSLNGHLLELRRRMVISAVALFICTIIAFVFHRLIFEILMVPAMGFESLRDNRLIFTQAVSYTHLTLPTNREV